MTELPPKLPDPWLAQIRDAVRQDSRKTLLLTVLGSSVVAALITGGLNWGLEWYKTRTSANVEKYKACLDIQKENLREKRAIYTKLAEKYMHFKVAVDNTVATCETAANQRNNTQLLRFAYGSLDGVSEQLAEIQAATQDPSIDQQLRSELTKINDVVGPLVAKASDDNHRVARLEVLPELVQSYKQSLQPQINQTGNQLQSVMTTLKPDPCF